MRCKHTTNNWITQVFSNISFYRTKNRGSIGVPPLSKTNEKN